MNAAFIVRWLAVLLLAICCGCEPAAKVAPVRYPDRSLKAKQPPPPKPATQETPQPEPLPHLWAGPDPNAARADQAAPVLAELPPMEDRPNRYTWKEIDDYLAYLREQGKTDPVVRYDLYTWYERVASPTFTESKDYAQHLEFLQLWREEVPDSTAPLVVMAMAYTHFGWEARGIGLAHEVTQDGWRLLKERVAKAHELLDEAIKLGVKDGQAYASLILVAKAEGMPVEETRKVLAEGHKLDPTYAFMYIQMSDYLLPKWHGEPGDIAAFAKEVVEMVPGDDGLDVLAQIIRNCHCSDRTILFWGGIEPQTLNDAGRVFFERYPNWEAAANYAGLLAMAGGDYELGRRVVDAFEKQKFNADELAWGPRGFKQFEEWCRAPVHPKSEAYRVRGSLDKVRTLAFADDPRYVWIATLEAYTPVLLVDTHTGMASRPLRARGLGVGKLAFDAKQNLLVASAASLEFQGAVIWKLDEGDQPMPVPLPGPSACVSISPASAIVAIHEGTNVHLLDIEQRKLVHTLQVPDVYVNELVFSPDGKLLATYARAEVSVWEVETGKKRYSLPTYDAQPRPAIAIGGPYSIDNEGRLIAEISFGQGKWALGRFTEGEAEPAILLPDVHGGFATLSPDGKYFAVDGRGPRGQKTVDVWDVESKSIVQAIEGHALTLSIIRFSSDSKWLATGSKGGDLKIWKIEPVIKEE